MEHEEFVVLLKSGKMDWVDPVNTVEEVEGVLVVNNHSYDYKYLLKDIDKWCVRPYSKETTYDPIP